MIRDLAIKNRSYRAYDRTRRITREELVELVDMTRYVASSVNDQPLKYYIASEEADVAKVQKMTIWAKGLPELNLPYPGTEPVAFVVICIDENLRVGGRNYLRDVGAVAQTMLLAAVEKGLGGIMIGSIMKDSLKQFFNMPDNIEPNLVVAFGKPAEEIVITECKDGNTKYYRNAEGNIHYVPKRPLSEILMN